MPIYEYQCKTCGAVVEEVHHIKDFPREVPCPSLDCGNVAEKVISNCTFRLRGMGWTDGHGVI